jgi:hypothetical protein
MVFGLSCGREDHNFLSAISGLVRFCAVVLVIRGRVCGKWSKLDGE